MSETTQDRNARLALIQKAGVQDPENPRELTEKAQEIGEKAETAKRDLTDEEAEQVNALLDQKKEVDEADGITPQPVGGGPRSGPINPERRDAASDPYGTGLGDGPGPSGKPRRSETGEGLKMEQLFGSRRDKGGFRSAQDFFHTIHNGLHHPGLQAASMVEGTGADGGFLVPQEFSRELIDAALESEVVRPRADIVPMTYNSIQVPVWDTMSDHGTDIGGLSGEWLAEGQSANDEKAALRQIQLDTKKLAIYTKASNELVADGFLFQSRLMSFMRQALSWNLDDAFLNGSGAGQPVGVLNNDALITTTRNTSDKIAFGDLTGMYARMHPASLNRAVWICNPTTAPELLSAFANNGTVGANQPVLQQDANGSFSMFGRPVVFSEKLPKLGSEGDVLFADLSQYIIGLRQEMVLERSISPGWQSDESSFRVKVRVDGQGKWHAPVTPANGDTLSWSVALAA